MLRPRRASITGILLAILCVVAVSLVIFVMFALQSTGDEEEPILFEVIESRFEWQILDQGTVESSRNISIDCEIESEDFEGTPILEIIEEGKIVQPGEIVARFDPAKINVRLQQQKVKVNETGAAVAEAQSLLDAAVEEKIEYFSELDGVLARDRTKLESELIQAEKENEKAIEYLEFSKRLAARGYITESQYRQDKQSLEQTESKIRLATIELALLSRTKKRKGIEFDSKVNAAHIKLDNAVETNQLELAQLEKIKSLLSKCDVVVPEGISGQIVYPDRWDRMNDRKFVLEVGSKIREKQAVVLIPNPAYMQVKATVNESRIVSVKKDMEVTIKLDALPGEELKGIIERVGQFAEDQGWMSNGVNDYPVIIKIIDPPPALRSGMNASIAIHIADKPSAIQVPFLAVCENQGKFYSVVQTKNGWEAVEVKIGMRNDKMICIEQGLKAGDMVVLNPRGQERFEKLLGQ
jgi:multidrug resistance efflux pump